MSCDYAVWSTRERLSDAEAVKLYCELCDGDTSGVMASSAIDDFYTEITSRHPEIDDIPDEDVDDLDLCPWSIAFDRSPGHIILCCVWSRADYVADLVPELAQKHGLAVFDPQSECIVYSDSQKSSPWWRFWSN